MKRSFLGGIMLMGILLAGCGNEGGQASVSPEPRVITAEAVGHYCSMNLFEHQGPKGQIHVNGASEPVWFSTIQQVFAYTLLPEEPKGLSAIYVNDMGAVGDWSQKGANDIWIDGYKAFYVIESRFVGGMGGEDALPFSDQARAQAFSEEHGGRVVTFDTMPEEYILNYGGVIPAPVIDSTPSANGENR
ncbi:MAG: nitrous oxide reductase accessory protein NosL [Advenella sp.]|nr:nitrous oxide reductase accessory protein NosL [Advenella sp.]